MKTPILSISVVDALRLPPAPRWLGPFAAAEYERCREEIETAGEVAIRRTNPATLAKYAQAYAEMVRLRLLMQEAGEVIRQPNGEVCISPHFDAYVEAQETLLATTDELGFSPEARARINREYREREEGTP